MKKKGKINRFILREKAAEETLGTRKWLTQTLLLFLCLAGYSGFFISLFELPALLPLWLGGCLVFSALAIFLKLLKKPRDLFLIAAWWLVMAAVVLVFREQLTEGRNLLLNAAVNRVGKVRPSLDYSYYAIHTAEGGEAFAASGALLWAEAAAAMLLSRLMQRGGRAAAAVILLLSLAGQMIFGVYADMAGWFFLAAGTVFLWLSAGEGRTSFGRVGSGSLQAGILVAVLTAAIAGAFLLTQADGINWGSGFFSKADRALEKRVEELRYAGDAEILPEGDFTGLGSFEPTGREALKITMSEPDSVYLRGFVGGSYTGTGWEDADSEKRWEYRDLFYWLNREGFYGQSILTRASEALLQTDEVEERGTVIIENTGGSSRYLYTPYELIANGDGSAVNAEVRNDVGDTAIAAKGRRGQRTYNYEVYPNQLVKYPTMASVLLKGSSLDEDGEQYTEQEKYYNEYVYDAYLEIPAAVKSLLTDILGGYEKEEGQVHADYAEAKQNILFILSNNVTYSEELGAEWNGGDFVYEFLNGTKTGYSVHYASAAAMMLRYYGIPARYVEGYLLTPEDRDAMTAGEPYALDDTHAHAWAEYYQDGVGWIPFETTPAYLDVMEKPESYQSISGGGSGGAEEEEEEEQELTAKDTEPDMLLVVIKAVLILLLIAMVIVILEFLCWVLYQRGKTRKLRKNFDSEDLPLAMSSLYAFIMNTLNAAGIADEARTLDEYGPRITERFGEETANAYLDMVLAHREAAYSTHPLSETHRERMKAFYFRIREQIREQGSLAERFRLKYIYFL